MPWQKLNLIFYCIILFNSPACVAGDSLVIEHARQRETLEIDLRIPDKEYFDVYLEDKDYQYGGVYKPPASENIFQRMWRNILKIVALGFETLRYLPLIFKIVLILSCIVTIYVIATKTKLYKLFYSDLKTTAPEYAVIEPLGKEYDFDNAIAIETSQHNYRNAIRLLHLKILKELELNEIIRLSMNKTNREYTREIPEGNLRETFIGLTGIYNRIWYGKYPLSDSEYKTIFPDFQRFIDLVDDSKK